MKEDAAIGSMVRRYNDNLRRRACLLSEIAEVGRRLKALGSACVDDPSEIEVAREGWRIPKHGFVPAGSQELISLDIESFSQMIHDLTEVNQELRRSEEHLRQAGLTSIITSSS